MMFANPLVASATMDRLVHRAVKIVIDGKSYRMDSFVPRSRELPHPSRRTRNEAESARSTGVSRFHLARRRGLAGAPCNTRASHYWEGCHARRTGFDTGYWRRCGGAVRAPDWIRARFAANDDSESTGSRRRCSLVLRDERTRERR